MRERLVAGCSISSTVNESLPNGNPLLTRCFFGCTRKGDGNPVADYLSHNETVLFMY